MRSISGTIPVLSGLSDERPSLRHLLTIRWGMLLAALALTVAGLMTVRSASAEMPVDYLPRQLVWAGLALVVLLVAFAVDYRLLFTLAVPAYVLSLLSLVVILVVGHEAGGARSWIRLGALGGQPSEFAKLATAILLARQLSAVAPRFLGWRQILEATAIVALPMLLIAPQPDYGGAAMLLPILAAALLVGGVRLRLLALAAVVVVVAAAGAWTFAMRPYQKERVLTFLQPERAPLGAGYQVRQSKIAVGSGQITGKGYLQGTQSQLRFLPARHTDFIFAVLAEEWGFLGVVTTLGLYAFFLWNGLEVVARARDRAGVLLVVTLLAPMTFHILYNTAMVVGLLPITGIPLPFLSYGGSFLLYCFATTGIVLGVDFRRYVNR